MNKYPVIILMVVAVLAMTCNRNIINIKYEKLDINIIDDTASYADGDTIVIKLEVYHKSSDIGKCPVSPAMFRLEPPLSHEYIIYSDPAAYFENVSKDTLILLNPFAKDTIQVYFISHYAFTKGHYYYQIYLYGEVGFVDSDSVYQYSILSADSIVIDFK